jgi:hypothetical protein
VLNAAHNAGLKIFPYFYIYGGSPTHKPASTTTVQGEIDIFNSTMSTIGGDGAVLDIEGEYGGAVPSASEAIVQYAQGIGKSQSGNGSGSRDNFFIAYSTFPYVHLHLNDPFIELGDYFDASMPQAYWSSWNTNPTNSHIRPSNVGATMTPTMMVDDVNSEYSQIAFDGLHNVFYNHPESIKPVIITGMTYDSKNTTTAAEITEFINAATSSTTVPTTGPAGVNTVLPYGYRGINFFDDNSTSASERTALASATVGVLPGAPATPSPANGGNFASPGPSTLDWADIITTNTTGAATSYDVYIDGALKGNVSTSNYSISPALSAGAHTWQVRAKNLIGITNGPTWSFNIVAPVPPPANLAASDGLFNNKVGLNWDAAAGATKYQLYRSTINDVATAAPLLQVNSTSYDDSSVPANQTYYYWVAAVNSVNVIGSKGTSDPGFSDSIAPTATPGGFQGETGPAYIDFTFSESVGTSIDASDLSFANLDSPGGAVPGVASASWIAASNTARYFLNNPIPDANFRAILSGVNDPAGNAAAGTMSLDFSFLTGDATGDRTVNALDFNVLASHFGNNNAGFSGGDFNFDNIVNSLDFNALATRFGTSLPPTPPPGLPAGAALGSLFSASAVKQSDVLTAPYPDLLPA